MKTNKKDLALGIIMILILLTGVFFAIRWIWGIIASFVSTLSTLDTVLVVALISGAITIVGLIVNSIISILIKRTEYKNAIRSDMRTKMEEPYKKFVKLIFDLMLQVKNDKIKTSEFERAVFDFSKEVILYGSNDVIKKWNTCRSALMQIEKNTANANKGSIEGMFLLEEVLYAIRDDLGLKRKGMVRGDILSLFINDLDKYILSQTGQSNDDKGLNARH